MGIACAGKQKCKQDTIGKGTGSYAIEQDERKMLELEEEIKELNVEMEILVEQKRMEAAKIKQKILNQKKEKLKSLSQAMTIKANTEHIKEQVVDENQQLKELDEKNKLIKKELEFNEKNIDRIMDDQAEIVYGIKRVKQEGINALAKQLENEEENDDSELNQIISKQKQKESQLKSQQNQLPSTGFPPQYVVSTIERIPNKQQQSQRISQYA